MEKEEPVLADIVMAWLNDTHKSAHVLRPAGRFGKTYDAALLQHKIWMRRAHRFTLDTEFTKLATEAANATADKILNRVHYATLPYETTWLEFRLIDKLSTSVDMGTLIPNKDTVLDDLDRMGYLLIRVNQTDMLVVPVISTGEDRASGTPTATNMIAAFFSTVPVRTMRNVLGYSPAVVPQLMHKDPSKLNDQSVELAVQQGAACLWGYVEQKPKHGDTLKIDALPYASSALSRHAYPLISSFYRPFIDQSEATNLRAARLKIGSAAAAEMKEFAGHLRWLVTVLAMLNEVPIQTRELKRDMGYRPSFRHKRPEISHHVVTLAIPRTKPIQRIERHLRESGHQNRAHDVRSHWRTYLSDRPCGRDEHVWEYDTEHGYRLCGNCMTFGRLIPEHVRGNAELGWVKKEYKIVKGDPSTELRASNPREPKKSDQQDPEHSI